MTIRAIGQTTASIGLIGTGTLHLLWGNGHPWPATTPARLADAVLGDATATIPSRGATLIGVGLIGAGVLTAARKPSGRAGQALRYGIAAGMLARAALGGTATTALVLKNPEPSAEFLRLNRTVYRPVTAAIGIGLLLGSRRR